MFAAPRLCRPKPWAVLPTVLEQVETVIDCQIAALHGIGRGRVTLARRHSD